MKRIVILFFGGLLLAFSSLNARPLTGNDYFGLGISHTDVYGLDVWTTDLQYNMNFLNEPEGLGIDLFTSLVHSDMEYGDELGFHGALPLFMSGHNVIPYLAPIFGYSGNDEYDHHYYGVALGCEFVVGEKGNIILQTSRLESNEFGNLGVNISGEFLINVTDDVKVGANISWNDRIEKATYGLVLRWLM